MNPLSFVTQMIRIAVPYLFAASGGVVAERAGIVSLTLEGFMLSGAFAAVLGTSYSGSPWVGVLCGMVGGLIFSLIHAVATIRYRADQVVVGVAIWTIGWLRIRARARLADVLLFAGLAMLLVLYVSRYFHDTHLLLGLELILAGLVARAGVLVPPHPGAAVLAA